MSFLARQFPRGAGIVACGALLACGAAPPSKHPARGSVLRAIQDAPQPPPKKIERLTVAPSSASKVTFQRIAKIPEPGWSIPRAAQHSPDGKSITFLASESHDETMSLFAYDLATGKSDVLLRAKDLGGADSDSTRSREEELRRERQRDRSEGITSYVWAKKAPVMVLPQRGDVWVRTADGKVKQLTKTPEPEIDARPCDSGERVAFVRKGELWIVDVASGKETQLTTGAIEGVTHGLSDFVGQEEQGEPNGYFWSPKCDRIAYLEVDERAVDKVPVLGWRAGEDLMLQRYPRVATRNPLVRAGIIDIATKRTTWLATPAAPAPAQQKPERYLGRFVWAPDASALFHQWMPRDQKQVVLERVDPSTGKTTELAREASKAWVHFSPMKPLERAPQLLFTTTKSGHRHLELRGQKDGTIVRQLTKGDWDVDSIAAVDETAGRVLFTGTKDGSLQRHLYAVSLSGEGDITKLTPEPGVHTIRADDTGRTWVDVHSASARPPVSIVVRDGKPAGELRPMPVDPDIAGLELRAATLVQVKGADGTPLNGAVLPPRQITGRHPAIVMVYGGPESQQIFDSWAPRLFWQHLADRGFVVFQVDGRGTGGRGTAFSQKVHKQLGKYELEDQIAGAQFLASLPFVDASRIGIYGHSYGGFMAALAMLEGHGAFQAGVAGSPVTDWRLYDTGYTERYMEVPGTNPDGYSSSDLSKKAANLTGKLLLTHASMDENVHYANTARLIDALVAADKKFDLLVLPGERHGVRVPAARAYVPERIATFFADNL